MYDPENDNDEDDQVKDTKGVNAYGVDTPDVNSALDVVAQVMQYGRKKNGLSGDSQEDDSGGYYSGAVGSYASGGAVGGDDPEQGEEAPSDQGGQGDFEAGVPTDEPAPQPEQSNQGSGGNLDAAWSLAQHYRQRYTSYKAFANAAMTGSPQRPPDIMAAAQAATQAWPYALHGSTVQFVPHSGGVTAMVTNHGERSPSQTIPMSAQQFKAFLSGPASQFDNVQSKGPAVLGGQQQAPQQAPQQSVQAFADGGTVEDDEDITTQNPADQETDVDESIPESEASKPTGEADVYEDTPAPGADQATQTAQANSQNNPSLMGSLLRYVMGQDASTPQFAAAAEQEAQAANPGVPAGEEKVAAVQAAHDGAVSPMLNQIPQGGGMQAIVGDPTRPTPQAAPRAQQQQPQTEYDKFINNRRPGEDRFDAQDIQMANSLFPMASQAQQRANFLLKQQQQGVENEQASRRIDSPFGRAQAIGQNRLELADRNNASREKIAEGKQQNYADRTNKQDAQATAKLRQQLQVVQMQLQARRDDQHSQQMAASLNAMLRAPVPPSNQQMQKVLDQFYGNQPRAQQQAPQQQAPQGSIPTSADTRIINGRKYQKVQGGWQAVQ